MDLLPLPLGVPHPVRQFFTIYYFTFVSSFHFLCYTLQRAEQTPDNMRNAAGAAGGGGKGVVQIPKHFSWH